MMSEVDLSKKAQAGKFSRREKLESKKPQGQKEDWLQKFTIDLLHKKELEFIRITDDVWNWISWNAPAWVKLEMAENYGGWPDQLIFVKRREYNLVLLLELKRKGRRPRTNQKEIAKQHNVKIAHTEEEITRIINDFVEYSKKKSVTFTYEQLIEVRDILDNPAVSVTPGLNQLIDKSLNIRECS